MSSSSDQLSIDTPELVAIELPLAGIGSRFIALLVDMLIWVAGILALALIVWVLSPALQAFSQLSYQWVIALVTLVIFVLNWGYFTLFEAFWNGRTPGKRVARIRVIQSSGRPISLFESMARNLVRYIDQIPFFYAVGIIAMFATRRHQRLGDLAAGTLVVRDREEDGVLGSDFATRTFTAQIYEAPAPTTIAHPSVKLPAAGIARLSLADLEVLEGFFSRRLDMSYELRQSIADKITAAIQSKSALEIPRGVSAETFLEVVARDLRNQARLR